MDNVESITIEHYKPNRLAIRITFDDGESYLDADTLDSTDFKYDIVETIKRSLVDYVNKNYDDLVSSPAHRCSCFSHSEFVSV